MERKVGKMRKYLLVIIVAVTILLGAVLVHDSVKYSMVHQGNASPMDVVGATESLYDINFKNDSWTKGIVINREGLGVLSQSTEGWVTEEKLGYLIAMRVSNGFGANPLVMGTRRRVLGIDIWTHLAGCDDLQYGDIIYFFPSKYPHLNEFGAPFLEIGSTPYSCFHVHYY